MCGSEGCYLWQVGDTDHLSLAIAHLLHYLRHLLGNLSTYTGVNLIEDDCRQFDGSANHRLERQHQSGNLTARRHLCHLL